MYVVLPAGIVCAVSDFAVKSDGAVADPSAVAMSNVTAWLAATPRLTVNWNVVVPLAPSALATSLITRRAATTSLAAPGVL